MIRTIAKGFCFSIFALIASPASFAGVDRQFDTLRVAIGADPVGLDPALHFHAPGKLVLQHIGEALVAHRDDMSIAPMLAESFEVSDDGRTYTFQIRKGARFHNGDAVTANDVVYAFQDYYLNPDVNWECRIYYDGSGSVIDRSNGAHVTAIEATATDTVVFRLKEPSNLFLARMADVSCAPLIFHRDSLDSTTPWQTFVGSGPYQFVHWKKGEEILLRRFVDYVPSADKRDGYSGAKHAYANELVLRIMQDRSAQLAALRDGDIDIVLDVQAKEYGDLAVTDAIRLHTTSTINFWNLLLQTEDPLLSDIRIRRAMAHAIDVDYLAAVMTDGRQVSNASVISSNSEFYSESQRISHALDPAKSRKLLLEAGYDGQPVEIVANRDTFPEMAQIGVLVRSMLRAVGINAVLNIMPWDEQLNARYQTGKFQLQAFGQGGRNHPLLVFGKFIGPKAEKARFQWDDDEALATVRAAQRLQDPAELQSVLDDLHLRMLDEVPTLALFNFEYHDATRDNLQGFHTTPFMRTTLWGVWKDPLSDAD